nr:hypothetical protein [Petrachloros mirabilis]
MQVKHWQSSGRPQQKSRKTPKTVRRKQRLTQHLRRKLKSLGTEK